MASLGSSWKDGGARGRVGVVATTWRWFSYATYSLLPGGVLVADGAPQYREMQAMMVSQLARFTIVFNKIHNEHWATRINKFGDI